MRRGGLDCETLTLFLHEGEGDDGRARYRAVPMEGVVSRAGGTLRQEGAVQGRARAAQVYLFTSLTRLAYVEAEAYAALGEPARARAYTLRADGRDWVARGLWRGEDLPPPGRRWRVAEVAAREVGSERVQHVRVGCV